jgi:hypothetical protein
MPERFTAYMDGIDFQSERGQPCGGNSVYATPEAVLEHRKCSGECGVVEVEVKLVRWVREQNLGPGRTREEVEAERARRRAELEAEVGDLVDEIWGKPKERSVAILADWITERRRTESDAG